MREKERYARFEFQTHASAKFGFCIQRTQKFEEEGSKCWGCKGEEYDMIKGPRINWEAQD
jgi:hypothetical protein